MLKFDGEAVEGGRMDVRELAPSLLGFSDAVQSAHSALHPDDELPRVEIVAANDGSIEISLEVVSSFLAVAQQTMTGNPSAAARHLQQAVSAVLALFDLLVTLRGRPPDRVEDAGDGRVHINVAGDDNTITVNNTTLQLYENPNVRKGAQEAVRPLSADGIDSLELNHRDKHAREPPRV